MLAYILRLCIIDMLVGLLTLTSCLEILVVSSFPFNFANLNLRTNPFQERENDVSGASPKLCTQNRVIKLVEFSVAHYSRGLDGVWIKI